MSPDPGAILALISELYATVARLTDENIALRQQIAAERPEAESSG